MSNLFTVGAGVMIVTFKVVGVGVSAVKPISGENVTSCERSVTVTFEARAVKVVA